jgi:hypothetical protein
VAADHAVDPRRHGGREQRGLPGLGGVAEDLLDVVGEAHVEHLVGLVEHDRRQAAQLQRAPVDVVDRASRGRHHDVDAASERPELTADRLAAVDRKHPRPHVARVAVHRLGDLHRELAGGDQHQRQRLRPAAFGEDPLEDRKREGGRLPRPRRCLPDQVTALQQGRDRRQLDRRWLLITEAGERTAQLRGQHQIGEAARRAVIPLLAVTFGHERTILLNKHVFLLPHWFLPSATPSRRDPAWGSSSAAVTYSSLATSQSRR